MVDNPSVVQVVDMHQAVVEDMDLAVVEDMLLVAEEDSQKHQLVVEDVVGGPARNLPGTMGRLGLAHMLVVYLPFCYTVPASNTSLNNGLSSIRAYFSKIMSNVC